MAFEGPNRMRINVACLPKVQICSEIAFPETPSSVVILAVMMVLMNVIMVVIVIMVREVATVILMVISKKVIKKGLFHFTPGQKQT